MSMAMKYAMMKRAKMAKGGEMCAHGKMMCGMCHGDKMAEGGFVEEEKASGYGDMPMAMAKENQSSEMSDDEILERIMRESYSEGGEVANETPITADFEPNEFDEQVKDDDLAFSYDGANSGDELGNAAEDEDEEKEFERIMRSRSKKGVMPRPA